MRTFLAIDIPEDIKEKIISIQNKLPEFEGKKTERENLHLTLKFLGEIDEDKLNLIREKLRKIKFSSFETEIDSIGFFSERIIWLHVKNCDELQKQIDSAIQNLFEKEKRFMGHLTIARIKRIRDKKNFIKKINEIKIPKIKFYVDSFSLKKSTLTEEKPIYEDVERFKLKI